MAAGGMENPGAIFLRESWTMIGEDASPEMKRWAATLLAHEISHLWVGDLVTMEWWNDIWLNEGLATWLSIKALRAWAPEIGTEEMQASRRMRTFDEDSLPGRRAVAAPLVGDESLFEIFDIVTNEKPAAVMSMIEQIAGEPAVRRAMRTYLIRHSWGNASTADFVALVESEIGQDAAAVMHDYVSRPGYPVVEVSSGCEGSSRRVLFEEVRSDGESWTVPVCYRPLSNAAMTECVVLRGRTSVTIDADCNVPLLVNPGLPGYFRVLYDRRELGRIVESTSALSIPEKLNLLDNEWWLVMEGHHSLGDYLTMLEKGFAAESDPSVVTMIVSRLSFVDRTYVSAESRAAFTEWLRSYLGPQLRRVGLRPANDETQEQASLRRELLWAAGALARDPEVLRFAQQYVRDYLSRRDPGDPSDEALYNAYLARVRRARNPQEGYRFLMGLTSFTSPDLVRRTFELTLTNVVRAQDASNIIGKLLSNPESAEPAWQVARERWIEIRKRLPETFTSERIVHATGSFCSAESRDEVASFFEKNAAARKTLRMSLARIDRCVATRPANLAALGTWLSDSEPHLRAVAAGP
jgi:aminopeptidase N